MADGGAGEAGAGAADARPAGWPLPAASAVVAESGVKSMRKSCQLASTDEGSSRNLRYISSTSHSFWPNGELVLLTEPLASIPLPVLAVSRLSRRRWSAEPVRAYLAYLK